MKIKWKVSPEQTGRYRSFFKRQWPGAEYADGRPVARVISEEAYVPALAAKGEHLPLKLWVACYETKPWKWRVLVKEFKTLAEAKAELPLFLTRHLSFVPADLQETGNA